MHKKKILIILKAWYCRLKTQYQSGVPSAQTIYWGKRKDCTQTWPGAYTARCAKMESILKESFIVNKEFFL